MTLLLLDPLVLLLYAGVVAYAWVVISGRFRAWFRPDRLWLGFWPLPVVAAATPLLLGPLLRAAQALTPGREGGVTSVAAFLIANLVVIVGVSAAPPRLLLPRWARRRLTPLPVGVTPPADGATPALHASNVEARVSWPRWRWRIDAIPGHAWVADGQLRFQACEDGARAPGVPELDEAEVAQLELRLGADARLQSPRGGWWTRHRLEVDLTDVDAWRVSARRPWSRSALLSFEVEGRRPVRVWVAEVEGLRAGIAEALAAPERRPDEGRA
jgi:hypothetical protein